MAKKKKKKLTFNQRYEQERVRRLAWSIGQFWPIDEELPDDDARRSEIYFNETLLRMSHDQRVMLVKQLLKLRLSTVNFFDSELPLQERKRHMDKLIERFPLLCEARDWIHAQCSFPGPLIDS
jgi:hypothetical protein